MKFPKWLKVYGQQDYRGNCPQESAEQITFFGQLRSKYPDTLGVLALHPKNEEKRKGRDFQKLARDKALGLAPGASDIIIPGCPAFVCEMKRRDNTKSKWQPGQLKYLEVAHKAGAFVCVALGWEAALEDAELELEAFQGADETTRKLADNYIKMTCGDSHLDDAAVDRFAEAMKAKLAKKRAEGRAGWEDPQVCPAGRLQQMLLDHLTKGDPVDIGNFAMMIWHRGEAVAGQPAQQGSVPEFDYEHPTYCEIIERIAEATHRLLVAAGHDAETALDMDEALEANIYKNIDMVALELEGHQQGSVPAVYYAVAKDGHIQYDTRKGQLEIYETQEHAIKSLRHGDSMIVIDVRRARGRE